MEVCLTVVQVVGLNDLLRVVRNTGTFDLERAQNKRVRHKKDHSTSSTNLTYGEAEPRGVQ